MEITVKQFLHKLQLDNCISRLDKFKEIKAPAIIIESITENIKYLTEVDDNIFEFGGDKFVVDWTYMSHEIKTGNGGKKYFVLACKEGNVNYFPNARYGIYIKIAK